MKNDTKINYKVYARKSSEAEDRQALSIESQTDEARRIVDIHKITINNEDILSESKSAKSPYTRPVFEQLIKLIEKGDAQGIIAWHPNRLSRNAIDAARLIDLFDRGLLTEIITQQQVFKNTPNDKFMLMLFCSQAKMENDNKSIDVKRGLRKKCEMGFPPGVAKVGYMNDYGKKGDRKILVDPDRFDLVKDLLLTFLAGRYSVRRLLEYSDKNLRLKTIERKKEGGKPLKLSRLYEMLKDPFYAGFFYAKNEDDLGVRYEANELIPRMITEEQYWQIQEKLGRKGMMRPKIYRDTFAYKGPAVCGGCGGSVTAEHKHQVICAKCKFKFSYNNKEFCPKCGLYLDKMDGATYCTYN